MDIVSYFNCIPEEFLEENSDIYRFESFEDYFETYDNDDWKILKEELTDNPDYSLREIVDKLWMNYNGDIKLGDYYYHSTDFDNYLDCLTQLGEEQGLSEDEAEKICDRFAEYVSSEWKKQQTEFTQAQNRNKEVKLNNFEKTFVLDEEIIVNDDRESLNFYLWATEGMMKKLIDKVGFKDISYSDNYNFYVDLNVKNSTMKLTSTYYRAEKTSKENQVNVELELTSDEQAYLLKELEDYCFIRTGLSCLDNVNEVRNDYGLKELKSTVSLNDKLKIVQNRSAEAAAPILCKNDFDMEL